ncbi:hypothetical protein SAY86_011990 [Trapa natans]|uniref:Uncharacterized protein n=1 Tax=Trapa natans TaxID=22666 RepID=A0AAN7RB66_TRANT|nr:hypothetical protein SAY86_011990 [Trapa natans]
MKDMVVPGSRPDFSELVWENGTLLVRGRTSPNSGAYTTACPRFFSNNQLVGCEEEDDDREFGGGGGESNRPDSDRNCELYQAPTSYLPSGFTPNNHALPKNIDFSKASSAGSHGGEMKRMNFSHFRGFDSLMFDADSVQGMGSGQHGMAPAKGVVVDNKLSKRPSDEMDVQTGNSQEQQQPIHAGAAGVLMAGSRDSLVPDEHSQAVVDSFVEEHFIREVKVDKASVLDEAIEYMKKLQLQLQNIGDSIIGFTDDVDRKSGVLISHGDVTCRNAPTAIVVHEPVPPRERRSGTCRFHPRPDPSIPAARTRFSRRLGRRVQANVHARHWGESSLEIPRQWRRGFLQSQCRHDYDTTACPVSSN